MKNAPLDLGQVEPPATGIAIPRTECLWFLSHGGLALSELTTQRQPVKTHFDPVQDRAQVLQILHRPSLTATAVL